MTLIDTATAAVVADVTPATIRSWVNRGKLRCAATHPTRYSLAEVAEVKDRRRVDNAP